MGTLPPMNQPQMATCLACHAQISSQARQCPYCGQPFAQRKNWYDIGCFGAFALFVLIILLMLVGGLVFVSSFAK